MFSIQLTTETLPSRSVIALGMLEYSECVGCALNINIIEAFIA